MRRIDRINRLKDSVKVINLKTSDKIVIFSDCHRGDGSFKDSLYPNVNIYITALRYYYNGGFTYIEAGDGDELWKFKDINNIFKAHEDEYKILSLFKDKCRLYMIYGNHDNEKIKKSFKKKILRGKNIFLKKFYSDLDIHEGIILKFENNKEFLVFHGHQLDYMSYELAPVSKFLVRYVWGFLNEAFSFREIISPAKSDNLREKVDNRVYNWCNQNKMPVIMGHTHNAIFPNENGVQYYNIGAAVLPYAITCIEIKNGTITLVKWTIKSIEDGILAVRKEILVNPRIIK